MGNRESVQQLDPYVNENHKWITQPEEVYSYRKNSATKEWEALISWKGLSPHEATWENCSNMKYQFPEFHLEDKVDLEEESDARPQSYSCILGEIRRYMKPMRGKHMEVGRIAMKPMKRMHVVVGRKARRSGTSRWGPQVSC